MVLPVESDKDVYTISDSSKQFDPRNNPIKETHIVDGFCNLSVGVRLFEPAVIGVIGQDSTDVVTQVLMNSSEQLPIKSPYLLNTNQSKTFVIGMSCNSVGVDRNILCMSFDSINSVGDYSRIGIP